MPAVRVVLAEPSGLIRSLLRVALGASEVTVVGETGSLAELLELCRSERPTVVVSNCTLADADIDDSLPEIDACGARLLVIAREVSPERLTALLSGGVWGYLVHDTAPDAVLDAVRAVARGEVALHPQAASLVVDQWRWLRAAPERTNDRLTLTPREGDVLEAMADGLSTKAIARRLGVAVKTVENHKTRVFDKLGVRSQAHAVGMAISQGLLSDTADRPTPVGGV